MRKKVKNNDVKSYDEEMMMKVKNDVKMMKVKSNDVKINHESKK